MAAAASNPDNNGDIAEHLGISRAQVTKIFNRLQTKGAGLQSR
jgi:DNA-binding MarR family transcriptional regulator